jgi:VCBS repeat-containing protein
MRNRYTLDQFSGMTRKRRILMRKYAGNSTQSSAGLAITLFMMAFLCLFCTPVQAVKISGTLQAGESSMSADGKVVYIEDSSLSTSDRKVYLYNGTPPSSQITYTGTAKANYNPSISANGTYVVFIVDVGFPNGSPVYKSVNGGSATSWITGLCSYPSIDNSGSTVTYNILDGANYKIKVTNGGGTTELGTVSLDSVPVLSADGMYVAYRYGANVYLKRSNGSSSVSFSGSSPAISYTGNRVAYVDGTDVKVYNRTSATVEFTVAGSSPAISATNDATDGNFVAYVSGGNVYVHDLATGNTSSYGTGGNPSISGDGGKVSLEKNNEVHLLANTPPTITAITDIDVYKGQSDSRSFTIGDAETSVDSLILTKGSSNTTLVPLGNITFGGSGASRTVTVQGAAGQVGSSTITVNVSDGVATASRDFTFTATNRVPVASSGTLTVDEDSVANPGTLVATDADGDALTYSIVTPASHGTATITNAATGAYTYTPDADYNGADSFTFKANDGLADSNTATISVTVDPLPDAPVASNGTLTVNEDSVDNPGTLVATDADGDPLTFSIVTPASNGTAVITNATTGAYTYTPNAGYDGGDSFTFKANDGTVDSNTATITITVVPHPAPAVTDITPNTHENTGRLTVTNLAGTGFRAGATVQLQKSGQPSITAMNVVVVSGTQITCDFNFMSNAVGAWNVVVINVDAQSGTLANGVTLTAAPPTIAYITPNSGVNTGSVAITDLAGSGFVSPTVELRRTGETSIPMTGVTLFGTTKITGSFDLTGATTGAWDVVVTNSDLQSATLASGFTIGANPAPAPTGISPTTVQKPGTKTITVNGSNFDAVLAGVTLTKSGQSDRALSMTSRTATQLKGTVDIGAMAVGLWNVVVTNGDGQSATLANALSVVEAALTGVTLTTDKAAPQPTGATITLTATKTGTATDVEYQFWTRYYNQTTSLWGYQLLRDYATDNTYAWQPVSSNSYWLYVYAREVGSGVPYQVVSPEVYFKIEPATLTGVTLGVSPSSPRPVGTTLTFTATKSGTAENVEYRFIYKWKNPATGVWQQYDIRGYGLSDNCTWAPSVAGDYRFYVYARIVGSTASFDKVSPLKSYTINPL